MAPTLNSRNRPPTECFTCRWSEVQTSPYAKMHQNSEEKWKCDDLELIKRLKSAVRRSAETSLKNTARLRNGGTGRTRTANLEFRKLLLCPIEPRPLTRVRLLASIRARVHAASAGNPSRPLEPWE